MKWLLASVSLVTGLACAQTTYRWVDEQGKVHYGDRPPAASAGKVEERKINAPVPDRQPSFALRQAMASYPVTLYSSSDCGDICRKSAEHLRKRGIPFTEKSVETKEDADALAKIVSGETRLPILLVGSRNFKGYEEAGWNGLLDAAGYPKNP